MRQKSRVEHVYWILDKILAGRPGPMRHPWYPVELRVGGIDAIVSLAGPVDSESLTREGIDHFPFYQGMNPLMTEGQRERYCLAMAPALQFLKGCRRDGKAAIVHCFHGCDRTGVLIGCYLVANERMPASDAVDRIRKVNPHALGTYGYCEAISTFERLHWEDASLFEIPQQSA